MNQLQLFLPKGCWSVETLLVTEVKRITALICGVWRAGA
jgi:hypothetical protein